jgi:hypothetical protein
MLIVSISASCVPLSMHKASAECQPDAPVPALKLITEIEHYSFADEYVTILGQIRKDVIIEGQTAELLISLPDGSVQSEILPVDPVGGGFIHSLPLDITDDKRFGRYNATAEYGAYVANWSFNVSPGVADFGGSLIGKPRLQTANGDPIVEDKVSLGQQVMISTEFKNPWDWKDQPVVVIIEVRDSDGITVFFGLQSRVLKPDCGAGFGVSWLASEQGNFQVRSFALNSLEIPSLLSPVMSTDVVVLESGVVEVTNAGASHVIDTPLNFNDFRKISISVKDVTSVNPDLEIQAVFDPTNNTVIFRAANIGNDVEYLNASHWNVDRSIGGQGGSGNSFDQFDPIVIQPGHYAEIAKEMIEFDPYEITGRATFEFDLEGFNWDEARPGNRLDYGIEVTIWFGYDVDAIAEQSMNRLLRADNMFLAITGTGDPFDVDDEHSRRVEIYLVNDGKEKISSDITNTLFTVWPLSKPRVVEGTSGISDYFDSGGCGYLEPGERKRIGAFAMSKTSWPVNKISEKLDGFASDIYMLQYRVSTRSCTLENGEHVAGGNKLLLAAFVVK